MELFYREYGKGQPVVILHGLLGSGRNWHTIATELGKNWRVIVPDLRNHGRSPHAPEHHLFDMAGDIWDLLHRRNAVPAVVMGHSMGGLVAMEMAFKMAEILRGVIVVDIVPRPHRAGVSEVLAAMAGVRLARFSSKGELDEALEPAIPDPLVRQFVLTNFVVDAKGPRWRVNLPALQAFLQESQAYNPAPTDRYDGPCLFIRGGQSGYIRDKDFTLIQHFFPRVRIETVPNAGHWVHYQAPEAVIRLARDFMAAGAEN